MNETNSDKTDGPIPKTIRQAFIQLLSPISLTAFVIILSVLVLIGVNLLGLDKGRILDKLADMQYARGLITYLFAVGTIGTVIVLILAALLGEGDMDSRFGRAKEILTLLIGLFGTIIGFYFGSQLGVDAKAQAINLSEPLMPETVVSGETFTYISFITGGEPPYLYSIGLEPNMTPNYEKRTQGWINEDIKAPVVASDSFLTIRLDVKDAKGNFVDLTKKIIARKQE